MVQLKKNENKKLEASFKNEYFICTIRKQTIQSKQEKETCIVHKLVTVK